MEMSSAHVAVAPAPAPALTYRTHYIYSWHRYQSHTQANLHSIDHYNAACEEYARNTNDETVMVLRDNVIRITGWYWSGLGWPAQNCADTDGYVDVRTGKKYTLHGETSFFNEIRR